jgi:ATP-dependent DNA ligase
MPEALQAPDAAQIREKIRQLGRVAFVAWTPERGFRQQIRPMLMRSPSGARAPIARRLSSVQLNLSCRPTSDGPGWSFEIKHDGFRIVPRKDGERVRLWSRNARDWSVEFRAIAEVVRSLSGVILDGEAVAHCGEGLGSSATAPRAASACFYAFDLLACPRKTHNAKHAFASSREPATNCDTPATLLFFHHI